MKKPLNPHPAISDLEKDVLAFWQSNDIFRQSIAARVGKEKFTFYDGPPFANGLPHYGHILAMAIKDLVTRYKTMAGYYVPRRNGWDTHGLPVEYEIEKELKIKGKRQIEDEIGIEAFNRACQLSVFRYVDHWTATMQRMGRWVDFNDTYATLENEYIESVWWALSEIEKKELLYQDFRSSPYCPRCGTPLSNFEVNQGYKENTKDPSIFVRFPLTDGSGRDLLAWTTTPWSLPGNAAVAVKPEALYLTIEDQTGLSKLIIAKDRFEALMSEDILPGKDWKITAEVLGSELVDLEYKPPYRQVDAVGAYRVVGADYVSLEDGSGLVHVAPAFGAEDFELGKRLNLPILKTINEAGQVVGKGLPGEGEFFKTADPLFIDDLEQKGILLAQQTIEHTYPFCWRCDSPLFYYALSAWFIRVSEVGERLLANNEQVTWQPAHLKQGRFGKWLEGARDWNISRNRFWGAPLPIWVCQECQKRRVVGSIADLGQSFGQRNSFLIARHAESEKNIAAVNDASTDRYPLTEKGNTQAAALAASLKDKGVTKIIVSPSLRTRQTAQIVADALGLTIEVDDRLREVHTGIYDDKLVKDYLDQFASLADRFALNPGGAESFTQVARRMRNLVRELNAKYEGETILIVSHGDPLWLLEAHTKGQANPDHLAEVAYLEPGEARPIVVNEIDLHRPWIDSVTLTCDCGGVMKRVPEVFDCWFESGSMPYAQWHYPFENKQEFEDAFPADFIAEGLDQTRGWFYTLHVLGTVLRDSPAYKNVIVNGTILAKDGRKLSKRLKNYTEPAQIFETFGVDALRYFLYSSTALGDDYRMDDQGVGDKLRSVILPLWNSLVFLRLAEDEATSEEEEHILDQWIKARLAQLIETVTGELDQYDLFRAARPIEAFIQDLSTWYIRRSRNRKTVGMVTTLAQVLQTTSQILAPFCPFISEAIWQELRKDNDPQSVHLCDWPVIPGDWLNADLIAQMSLVRSLVEAGHADRNRIGVKLRQPLSVATIEGTKPLLSGLEAILAEELNVKQIAYQPGEKLAVTVDPTLTDELRREGQQREIARQIQALRKERGLAVGQQAVGLWQTDDRDLAELLQDSVLLTQLPTTTLKQGEPGPEAATLTLDGKTLRLDVLAE